MKLFAPLLLSLLPLSALAAPEPLDKYLTHCYVTPSVTPGGMAKELASLKPKVRYRILAQDSYPGRGPVITSNKLALPAGKSGYADGELVYITGRVLDEDCTPVSDAIVDIWQADPAGEYRTASLGDRLSPYPEFAGSGRAVTDNLGRFTFVTLFPAPYEVTPTQLPHQPPPAPVWRSPHINVHIIQKDFAVLDTELFFENDKRNAEDPLYAHITSEQERRVTGKIWQRNPDDVKDGLNVQWDITLKGLNPYRHF